jgi:hypothetical protein
MKPRRQQHFRSSRESSIVSNVRKQTAVSGDGHPTNAGPIFAAPPRSEQAPFRFLSPSHTSPMYMVCHLLARATDARVLPLTVLVASFALLTGPTQCSSFRPERSLYNNNVRLCVGAGQTKSGKPEKIDGTLNLDPDSQNVLFAVNESVQKSSLTAIASDD